MLLPRFTMKQARQAFFDRVLIDKAVDRGRIKALSKAGAYIRRRARSSIRKRKAASRPGSPPTNRTGHLRDRIVFVYDSDRESVVVGPTLLNAVYRDGSGKPARGTVPQVLEQGGQIGILSWFNPQAGRWVRADRRSARRLTNKRMLKIRQVTIAARPYMGPAFEAEKPKFADLFLNSIN